MHRRLKRLGNIDISCLQGLCYPNISLRILPSSFKYSPDFTRIFLLLGAIGVFCSRGPGFHNSRTILAKHNQNARDIEY